MLRNQNCQNYYFFYQMSKVIKRRGGGCHPILPSFSWKNKHIILLTKTLTSGNFNLFLALFWFILGPVWSTLFYAKTPFLAVFAEIFLGSKWWTLRKGGEGYPPIFFHPEGVGRGTQLTEKIRQTSFETFPIGLHTFTYVCRLKQIVNIFFYGPFIDSTCAL